jgi:hypothetical protein
MAKEHRLPAATLQELDRNLSSLPIETPWTGSVIRQCIPDAMSLGGKAFNTPLMNPTKYSVYEELEFAIDIVETLLSRHQGHGTREEEEDDEDGGDLMMVVRVEWDSSSATRVELRGDFNLWKEGLSMVKDGNRFVLDLPLPPGLHQFKYLVDGVWMTNERLPRITDAGGNQNNFVNTYPMTQPRDQESLRSSQESYSQMDQETEEEDVDLNKTSTFVAEAENALFRWKSLLDQRPSFAGATSTSVQKRINDSKTPTKLSRRQFQNQFDPLLKGQFPNRRPSPPPSKINMTSQASLKKEKSQSRAIPSSTSKSSFNSQSRRENEKSRNSKK